MEGGRSARPAQISWAQWGAWGAFAAFAVLWAARWATFPLVLDPYYHLLIARQVAAAGGPIAYEWWQDAPSGRLHLYPPLLHVLLASGLKLGCSGLTVLRLASITLVLGLIWRLARFMQRMLDDRAAVLALCLVWVPFSFLLHAAVTLAATLGLIELLWYLEALQKGRVLAAGGLFGLLWYTHLGLPWVALAATCAYGWVRLDLRWRFAQAIGLGIVLAAPWWWHLATHALWLHPIPRLENEQLDFSLPLLVLAAAGVVMGWKDGRASRLLVCCWAAFALYGTTYWYRWWNGEGMMPLLLLATRGLWGIGQWWQAHVRRPSAPVIQMICVLGCLVWPTLVLEPHQAAAGVPVREWNWRWADTGMFHLVGWPGTTPKPLDVSLATPEMERLASLVARASRPGEILWSNADYAGGLVAALADRPMASAMFSEVAASVIADPVAAAHWIVWFKLPEAGSEHRLRALVQRYGLALAADTDLALVFRHPGGGRLAERPRAVIPLWVSGMLLCVVLSGIIWDFHRPNLCGVE